ncbi:MAG: tetratricopeptide repeat protein, partial [bacterium]
NIGNIYYKKINYSEAKTYFEKCISKGRENGDIYYKLGNIAMKESKPQEAVKYWKRSVELNPENEIVKKNLKLLEG